MLRQFQSESPSFWQSRDRPGWVGSEVLPPVAERRAPVGDYGLGLGSFRLDCSRGGGVVSALRDGEREFVLIFAGHGAVEFEDTLTQQPAA